MLGPSGSGKTTTLRMIAGFEKPDEGSIELAGEDVSRLPPYDRPVNTVFQDYALFPHMTVQAERRVRAHGEEGQEGRARDASAAGARDGAARGVRRPQAVVSSPAGSASASRSRERS